MALSAQNLVDSIENPNGHVSVRLQRNLFSKNASDRYFGRAIRNTHTVGNVLQLVADKVPHLDTGTVYSVCDALEQVIMDVLSQGNSVNCLNLGEFYIACTGTTDGKTTMPGITVKFTPSERTKNAISKITVEQEAYAEPKAVISYIQDIDTGLKDGTLTEKGSVRINGKKLCIGGEGSGIWFAPVENSTYTIDESGADWTQVSAALSENKPGSLLFPLPKTLAKGKYRIVFKTKCPTSLHSERKELVTSISDVVEITEAA